MLKLQQLIQSNTNEFIENIVMAIAVGLAAWAVFALLKRPVRRLSARFEEHEKPVARFLLKSVRIAVICVGGITALGTMGVNINALIASLGVSSLAIGLALKDLLTNTISGMLVLIYRPFVVGNTISVKGQTGRVLSIDLRYTILIGDSKRILIPNRVIFESVVEVNT